MGIFSSLLCCGSDTNDSADDKYKQVPRASLKEPKSRASANASAINAESEHSLSEMDKPHGSVPASTAAVAAATAATAALGTQAGSKSAKRRSGRASGGDSSDKLPNTSNTDNITTENNKLHTDRTGTPKAAPSVGVSATSVPSASVDPDASVSPTEQTKEASTQSGRPENADPTANNTAGTLEDGSAKEDSWIHDEEDLKHMSDEESSLDNDIDNVIANADEEGTNEASTGAVDRDQGEEEDDEDDEDDSLLDLTKIQKDQAFNPETGMLLGVKDVKRFGKKKCLILDLDETLVHSSFKYLRTADFVIPVEIDNQVHHVYVIKRPGVDEFLRKVGEWYEVVVFTASVAKYGDPLLNKLDIHQAVHHRLFRDSCYSYQGNFIKNLSQIGRPLQDSIIIDNLPASYIFHPQHSVPISSWFSDTHDNELLDLLPLLEDLSKPNVDDVSLVLDISI